VHGLDEGPVQRGAGDEVVDDAGDQRARSVERVPGGDRRQWRAEVLEAGTKQCDEDVFLRPDEVVDGRVADARRIGEAAHRQAVEPLCFDELRGGIEDAAPAALLALLPTPLLLRAPLQQSHISV